MPLHDESVLSIFTDGSSLPAPRRGGMGARFVGVDEAGEEKIVEETFQGSAGATNQQMEILAAVEALKMTMQPWFEIDRESYRKITIYSDSLYLVENFPKAKFEWPKTKWRLRDGGVVLNAEHWKALVKAAQGTGKRVEFEWVKGHRKNVHNRAADKLAKRSAKSASNRPLGPSKVRRKTSRLSTERGSVVMRGQIEKIRIIEEAYQPVQRTTKYRYEVVDPESRDFERVDIAFSTVQMRALHSYVVRFNDEPGNPEIVERYGETSTWPEGGEWQAGDRVREVSSGRVGKVVGYTPHPTSPGAPWVVLIDDDGLISMIEDLQPE